MTPKCIDARIMNTMMMMSIAGESKCIIEAFLVLKPPVAIVLKEWLMASKKDIPANIRSNVSATVSPT